MTGERLDQLVVQQKLAGSVFDVLTGPVISCSLEVNHSEDRIGLDEQIDAGDQVGDARNHHSTQRLLHADNGPLRLFEFAALEGPQDALGEAANLIHAFAPVEADINVAETPPVVPEDREQLIQAGCGITAEQTLVVRFEGAMNCS